MYRFVAEGVKEIGELAGRAANGLEKPVHRRPVSRVLASVSEAHDTPSIDDEIASQLERVRLDAAEESPARHELYVLPDGLGPKDAPEAAFAQPVSSVGGSLWVGKQRERYPQVACVVLRSPALGERDHRYLRICGAEVFVPVSQLRHVLPSGESSEMPDEDEDERLSGELLQGVRLALM